MLCPLGKSSQQTLYIIGGYFTYYDGFENESQFYDTILEFDADNFAWVMREERMAVGRSLTFMVDVNKNKFCD